MHRSEGVRPTWGIWLARNCTSLAMCASQTLEGPHADSRELVDLRVTEALKGHGECHFFELVTDVSTDHGWEGGRETETEGLEGKKKCESDRSNLRRP
jgi:hypothetical protein